MRQMPAVEYGEMENQQIRGHHEPLPDFQILSSDFRFEVYGIILGLFNLVLPYNI